MPLSTLHCTHTTAASHRQSEQTNCGVMANRNVYLILSLVLFTSFISSTQSASCCLSYTKRPLRCYRLLGYSIQTINKSCDINAIVFHIQGKFVCADPLMRWTQIRKNCVDQRRKTAPIAEERIHGSA